MATLVPREREDCRYDAVALGEVMLRLDPGEGRIRTAREFHVWEGGGEYNVVRGLRRCFGLRTAVVTAVVDNEVGRLVEDCILTGGVDASLIRWVSYDGVGRTVRNGLNFTERGFGVRGAVGVSDRGHTAASQLRAGDVDWDHLFGTLGARWFHTGGIFAGLSDTTPDVIEEAMRSARSHGTVISYDLNYRPSLWQAGGGTARAQEVNRRLARHVDVMIGNEGHFTTCLGLADSAVTASFREVVAEATAVYPNLAVVAMTQRVEHRANVNDWGAVAWSARTGFVEARRRPGLDIFDRVGGGDGFASGLVYGLMEKGDLAAAVEYGAAHGALVMTTPGDTSMATLAEVEKLIGGDNAHLSSR